MKLFMEKHHQDLEKMLLHFHKTLIVLVYLSLTLEIVIRKTVLKVGWSIHRDPPFLYYPPKLHKYTYKIEGHHFF